MNIRQRFGILNMDLTELPLEMIEQYVFVSHLERVVRDRGPILPNRIKRRASFFL